MFQSPGPKSSVLAAYPPPPLPCGGDDSGLLGAVVLALGVPARLLPLPLLLALHKGPVGAVRALRS